MQTTKIKTFRVKKLGKLLFKETQIIKTYSKPPHYSQTPSPLKRHLLLSVHLLTVRLLEFSILPIINKRSKLVNVGCCAYSTEKKVEVKVVQGTYPSKKNIFSLKSDFTHGQQ